MARFAALVGALAVSAASASTLACTGTPGITYANMVPFDMTHTRFTNNDDDFAGPIALPFALPFFGDTVNNIQAFVSNNGLISFGSGVNAFTPLSFPVGNRMVAAFWGDVDTRTSYQCGITGPTTRESGEPTDPYAVYYDVINVEAGGLSPLRSSIVTSVQNYVRAYGPDGAGFTPRQIMVATWDRVGVYGCNANQLNTFQIVLTSSADGSAYALLLYKQLQWHTGTASGVTPAQAGFNAGNGVNYYAIPGSQDPSILNLVCSTNVGGSGAPNGFYVFKINAAVIVAPSASPSPGVTPTSTASASPTPAPVDRSASVFNCDVVLVTRVGSDTDPADLEVAQVFVDAIDIASGAVLMTIPLSNGTSNTDNVCLLPVANYTNPDTPRNAHGRSTLSQDLRSHVTPCYSAIELDGGGGGGGGRRLQGVLEDSSNRNRVTVRLPYTGVPDSSAEAFGPFMATKSWVAAAAFNEDVVYGGGDGGGVTTMSRLTGWSTSQAVPPTDVLTGGNSTLPITALVAYSNSLFVAFASTTYRSIYYTKRSTGGTWGELIELPGTAFAGAGVAFKGVATTAGWSSITFESDTTLYATNFQGISKFVYNRTTAMWSRIGTPYTPGTHANLPGSGRVNANCVCTGRVYNGLFTLFCTFDWYKVKGSHLHAYTPATGTNRWIAGAGTGALTGNARFTAVTLPPRNTLSPLNQACAYDAPCPCYATLLAPTWMS